jgi:branched-chain amino acid transport system ATP-binding protein
MMFRPFLLRSAGDTGVVVPLLEVSGLTKVFGGVRAVDEVSFNIATGGITGLIGPNGAGKSTLFNAIAGSIQADHGQLRLAGRTIQTAEPHTIFRMGLARTFQIPRPFATMTLLENLMTVPIDQAGEQPISIWFRRARVAAQEAAARERAEELLLFMKLESLAHQRAGALSGGQQKLLELARVMMADPKLVLLDEPAAGVNPVMLELLVDRVLELNRSGITFFIIEHNMDLVMSICDPVLVMAQGRLIAQGTPSEIRRNPQVIEAYLGQELQ